MPEAQPLEPFQQRIVNERTELDERRAKLATFTSTPAFAALPAYDRALLIEQARAMEDYSHILAKRIARFAPATQSQWQAEMAARTGTAHHPV